MLIIILNSGDNIKAILLIFFIVLNLYANESLSNGKKHIKWDFEKAYQEMKPLMDKAIVIGEGTQKFYMFIDPLCKYSKKLLKMINKPKNLESKEYKYYIFLLRLPQFNSMPYIYYILESKNPKEELLNIMLKNKKVESYKNKEESKIFYDTVNEIGIKLDIYKRPYIFITPDKDEEDWD
ncbi:MAG: hypothetical protein ACI8WT_003946 [Clostridium sp.]